MPAALKGKGRWKEIGKRMVIALVFSVNLIVRGLVSSLTRKLFLSVSPRVMHCFFLFFYSIGYVGAQVATSLVYFLYMSEYCTGGNCAWTRGATYNVIAQGLYLGASILAGCMGEKPRETRKNKNNDGQPVDTTTPAAAADSPSKQGDALETGTVTSGSPNTPSVAPPPSYDSPPYATTY